MDWNDPIMRGLVALVAALILGILARLRFREKEGDRGAPDLGLD